MAFRSRRPTPRLPAPRGAVGPARLHALRRKSFLGSERGSVAVELAMLATPFFFLLFAIMETMLIFFASSSIEGAMNDATRMIRTGQVQTAGMTPAQFKQFLCDRTVTFIRCDNHLQVDIRRFDNFNAVDFPPPLDANGDLMTNFQFQPGNAGDIVLVRVFYTWDVKTPTGIGLSNMSNGQRLISSAAAFRNEPFNGLLPPPAGG